MLREIRGSVAPVVLEYAAGPWIHEKSPARKQSLESGFPEASRSGSIVS